MIAFTVGGIAGTLLGICVSYLVNQALLEISINPFFSILFGVSLTFMGLLIIYRVHSMSQQLSKRSISSYFVMAFASLVVVSGLLCFILEKNWFSINPTMKVPMYSILGVALWFALTFSIMDICNFFGQVPY